VLFIAILNLVSSTTAWTRGAGGFGSLLQRCLARLSLAYSV
jgi:hypothetical protein